ncbi:hypothetical protein GCM10022393_15970 [Aquimarina addita]|uniref:Ricin B lectin domain-containing protein n=1 Tax=Aquimarina addita TaxID=870485 RepID=A0ABP7XGA0_9FLAO
MKRQLLFLTLLITCFSVSNLFAQLPPGQEPGGKSWADSFQANGLCWCDSTFDHDLDDIDKVSYVINGVKRNIKDICDELKNHPLVRNYQSGDPLYNDIQCGNGPANTAIDETQCPGRVDLGRDGCSEIGPKWDVAWLASRPRFGGGSVDQLFDNGTYYIESPSLNERLFTSSAVNNNVAMDGESTSDQQVWTFSHLGDNVYTIKNSSTNRFLEVPQEICEDQANVGTWTSANNSHQKWQITENGSSYNLKPLHCIGKSLDRIRGASEANVVIHSASNSNVNQKWTIVSTSSNPINSEGVTILGESINKYANISSSSPNNVTTNSTSNFSTFTMEAIGGNQYTFKGENGKYLSSENGTKSVTCNRNAVGAWEIFTLESLGGDVYAIKGNNGLYLSHEFGNKAMNCNRSAIGSWERFVIKDVASSRLAPTTDKVASFQLNQNPISNSDVLSINVNLTDATDAVAQLYNLQGKLIAQQKFNKLDAGTNLITLRELQNATNQMGAYIVRFIANGKAYNKTVLFR